MAVLFLYINGFPAMQLLASPISKIKLNHRYITIKVFYLKIKLNFLNTNHYYDKEKDGSTPKIA